jgi:hypothetical protein
MGGLMDKEGIILRIRDVISSLPSLRVAGPGEEHSVEFAAHVGNILEEALGFCHECDVRVLNDEPVWFKYEIINTGVPMYIRNEEDRIDFETRVLVEYQDIKFMYDLFDEEYLAQV